jgi:hypothetical protein
LKVSIRRGQGTLQRSLRVKQSPACKAFSRRRTEIAEPLLPSDVPRFRNPLFGLSAESYFSGRAG